MTAAVLRAIGTEPVERDVFITVAIGILIKLKGRGQCQHDHLMMISETEKKSTCIRQINFITCEGT